MIIRAAQKKDLPQIAEIYNYEVLNGTSTFDIHPKTEEYFLSWFNMHNIDNHPLIVAEDEEKILGYASLSPYRDKEAYSQTVELSVYIGKPFRRMGIASRLMTEILKMAEEDKNTHKVISVITSGNEASRRLHEKYGFTFCGTVTDVGIKFGKYLSIDTYSLDT